MSDEPPTMSEITLTTMRERDALQGALQRLLHACRNTYLGDSDPDIHDAMDAAAKLLPNDGWPEPEATDVVVDAGGEVLTIPATELHPFDRLPDGRFIIAMHGGLAGRWTSMEVADVRAEVEVVATMGGEQHCLWQPTWEKTERIPIPVELTIVRGARFPGLTCTALGMSVEKCETCPARGDDR